MAVGFFERENVGRAAGEVNDLAVGEHEKLVVGIAAKRAAEDVPREDRRELARSGEILRLGATEFVRSLPPLLPHEGSGLRDVFVRCGECSV